MLPGESLVYLGDTARVPYGTKGASTVRAFARQDAGFLVSLGVKMVVVACNTASAFALDYLDDICGVPVLGVTAVSARRARLPCPISRRRGPRMGHVSPVE